MVNSIVLKYEFVKIISISYDTHNIYYIFSCCQQFIVYYVNKIYFHKIGFNERTIMAAITDLRSRIDRLHGIVTKIYIATCHPEETLEKSIGIPTLPLTSMEAFYKWEDFILEEDNKLIIVRKYFLL